MGGDSNFLVVRGVTFEPIRQFARSGTHPIFVAAIAAILFYLYIFLMPTYGQVLVSENASTRTLHRRALFFALFELLLP